MAIINQVVAGSGGGGSVSEPYINWEVRNGKLVSTTNRVMDFTGITTLDVGMAGAYKDNTNIIGAIDMSDIEYINQTCGYMFQGCTGITSADLSSLKEFNMACGYMFEGCTGLVSINLNSVYKWQPNYNFLANCTSLLNISIPSLTQVTVVQAFESLCYGCTSLIFGSFASLSSIGYNYVFRTAFSNCTSLQSLWFYALSVFGNRTNQFYQMLSGCTNVIVHFPMAIQSTIGSWSDVTGGFGGTNTTVSFDLVTSLTGADGNTYTRSEKDSTSTATAWTYNDTLYYTSGVSNNTAGVNEPSVSDAIYSDAACTTSVTTITSIA